MSTTPEFSDSQLLSARSAAWKQIGEPLLTLEAAREWVNNYGLILFAPHAQTLGAPAPSLVEATLGEANAAPTAVQSEAALRLLARLVAEGSAVPLNLLGGPGDVPDFVASAQVFSFCYTLRGDKAWKQPPAQTGAVKVSPLSLRVFEVLTERGSLTAAALASELGREVTHSAVVRALGELWGQLRVLPRVLSGNEGEGTAWELTTQRFTKAIKAGSNAGLPKALSALVSLYLHQAISASEGEVEAFLSPLTARSRIREVVNALTSARELETVVIDGKTLLYVADALPEFAALEPIAAEETIAPETSREDGAEAARGTPAGQETSSGEGRISRFKGTGTRGADLRGKPFRVSPGRKALGSGAFSRSDKARPAAGGQGGFKRPDRPARPTGERRPDQASRPSSRPPARSDRPSPFTRPWEEERGDRPPAATQGDRPPRPFRPRADVDAPRPFRPRSEGESSRPFRPRADGDAPRPFRPRTEGAGESARSFRSKAGASDRGPARRPPSDGGSERPRSSFNSRPGSSGGPGAFRRDREDRNEGAPGKGLGRTPGSDRPRSGSAASVDRGSRPDRRPFPRAGGERGIGERRPSGPRSEERGDRQGADARPPRPSWNDRGSKPARPGFERKRPVAGGFESRSGFQDRSSDRPRRERPAGDADKNFAGPSRGPKRFGAAPGPRPAGERPTGARPAGARTEGRAGGARPGTRFDGARPTGRSSEGGPSKGPSGGRPSGGRSSDGGSFGRSAGPRPGGGGFGPRGARPSAGGGPRAPKKGGTAFSRPPRPTRRPDEPAGEA